MTDFDAFFVDVGGVVTLPDHRRVIDALDGILDDVDRERLDRAHYVAVAETDRFNATLEQYLEAYATAAGVSKDALDSATRSLEETFRIPGRWSRPVPGSLDALRGLRHTGVPIVAITNTVHGRAEESLRANRMCQVGHGPGVELAAIVDSARVGVKKPDPRIFDIALRAVSCSPSRVVHVGDSVRTDVSGAINAGIRPIHFDPHSLCTDRSHAHIMSLAEMVPR